MKKTFTLTCLILASVIGAGFASGKEIEVFFTKYKMCGYIGILLAFLLFIFVFKLFLLFGNLYRPKNFFDAIKMLFGKAYKFVSIIVLICYFIVLAGMFAGMYEVFLYVFNITISNVMVLIFLVLVALQNGKGMGVVNKVNNFFIPIIMCVLVVVAILTIKTNTSLTGNLLTSLSGLNSAVNYVGINILLAGSMLICEGKNYTKNNIKSASFLSAFVLFLIILLFNIALSNNSFTSSMPMVKLSFSINYYVGLLTLICVLFAIYSSISSMAFVVSKSVFKTINGFKANAGVCLISYIISLFGFNKIVEFLYPIIGVVGIIFSVVLYVKLQKFMCKNKPTMQLNKNGFIK